MPVNFGFPAATIALPVRIDENERGRVRKRIARSHLEIPIDDGCSNFSNFRV
jgi:hypothetical protein